MYYREPALTARSARITRARAWAALAAALAGWAGSQQISTRDPHQHPSRRHQTGQLNRNSFQITEPCNLSFSGWLYYSFPCLQCQKKNQKPTGSSFGRLKGLWGFPADSNTVLCKCWQQREILFQLIIRSINERSCICWVVAMCLNTSSNRLLEILLLAPGWFMLRFRGLWDAKHHPCPMQGFPRESVLKQGLNVAFWKLNSNPLSVENVLNSEPFNKT